MNEEFNTDDTHQVDDLFRETIGDYSETPSDQAWSRMSRKLNRKEAVDFITFRKTKVSPGLLSLVPVYRRQWFRITAMSAVAAPMVFTAVYLISKNSGNGNHTPENTAEQNETLSAFNQPNSLIQLSPEMMKPVNNGHPDQTPVRNSVPVLPVQKNTEPATTPSQNNQQLRQTADPHQMLTISEIRDMANDPVIVNNLENLRQLRQKDSSRYHAARIVDSIIEANAILENQVLQSFEQQNHQSGEPDDLNQGTNGQGDGGQTEPIIIIPKAFTPNSDGLNDVLFIDGLEYYPDNTFVVHDVKGNIVFSKKEYRGDWNALGVPDGLYFYFLTYRNNRNVNITIKGVVTIIR